MAITDVMLGAGLALAGLIALEDFTERRIHLWLMIAFCGMGIAYTLLLHPALFWTTIATNLLLVTLIWLTVCIWFRLKGETNIMDNLLGWGDVVMLVGLAVWLPPTYFVAVYFAGTLVALSAWAVLQFYKKIPEEYPIPLAGWLALVFMTGLPLSAYSSFIL